MARQPDHAVATLTERFLRDHPAAAAKKVEQMSVDDVVEAVEGLPASVLARLLVFLLPDVTSRLLTALPAATAEAVLAALPPVYAVRALGHMDDSAVADWLTRVDEAARTELQTLLSYAADAAGRKMDTTVPAFRLDATAGATLERLRGARMKTARSLFLVDDDNRLAGKVLLSDVALADPDSLLSTLSQPVLASVRPTDPVAEVTQAFGSGNVLDLPVTDIDGLYLGAITHEHLAETIQNDATLDLQTMVGASKEERALSSPLFTFRKRMPWLQVNLVTAFMAAAVVGLFEDTIAQVTALAVLLPVVAGQSGNTGAQALAVTMRGLALREITIRQWAIVLRKEVIAGLLNGVAIAVTCGLGVYIWSRSLGMVAVIMLAMVIAMVAAGFAGAIIPVLLTRLGQDPATSSSIILTTVTDIAGFFAFLGIASLMMGFL